MRYAYSRLMTDLTAIERHELSECETIIERGLKTFVEVGTALKKIRDERLYKGEFGTFEAYCDERWGMKRTRAYQFIESAETSELLSTIVDKPASESVSRELAPLRSDPDKMRETWGEIVEEHGPTPTAAEVRKKVRGESFGFPEISAVGLISSLGDLVEDMNEPRHDWSTLPDEYREKLTCYIEFLQTL